MTPAEQIRRSLAESGPAHAYILEGEDAAEREACVQQLVQLLLCRDPDPVRRPCGHCSACRKVLSGSHEDMVVMEQSGKAQYVVKDAEDFMRRLAMSPYGDRLVGRIPNAENLSETVQNKLLKTLEEPFPGTVIFLSVSNREALLQTVRSRCVLLRMESAETAEEQGIAEELRQTAFFHEFRKGIDKNIKSQDDAMTFLDQLEISAGNAYDAQAVDRIEGARRYILRGMGYKQSLKRLYL